MEVFTYLSARQLNEACQMLADGGGLPVAGCTDVLPQMRRGRLKAERLVDLSRVDDLYFIEPSGDNLSLGALVTYEEILASSHVQQYAPALAQAAATVGCRQTRNRGTLGGNLGNASPAGDTLPPLLTLNSKVVLHSNNGERQLPLENFLLGPGKTALYPGEIIRQVEFERLPDGARSCFIKLGNRKGMAVSVVSVAIVLMLEADGSVADVRIALGAVAPTAFRCHTAERTLIGKPLNQVTMMETAIMAANACAPISDVRASASYRGHAVQVLVKRGLLSLL